MFSASRLQTDRPAIEARIAPISSCRVLSRGTTPEAPAWRSIASSRGDGREGTASRRPDETLVIRSTAEMALRSATRTVSAGCCEVRSPSVASRSDVNAALQVGSSPTQRPRPATTAGTGQPITSSMRASCRSCRVST